MKKKLFLTATTATMLLLAACGNTETTSTNGTTTEATTEAPTDLTGTWASEPNEGSYQEAVITENTIEINWVSEDTTALYWSGTYTAPDSAVNEYTWTSERDKEKTDTALMASGDDTKEFTYKDGVISYEVSMMGVTKTIELEKK